MCRRVARAAGAVALAACAGACADSGRISFPGATGAGGGTSGAGLATSSLGSSSGASSGTTGASSGASSGGAGSGSSGATGSGSGSGVFSFSPRCPDHFVAAGVDDAGLPLFRATWSTALGCSDSFLPDGGGFHLLVDPGANLFALAKRAPHVIALPAGAIDNYGILNTFPSAYPNFASAGFFGGQNSVVALGGSVAVNNYGEMGFQPSNAEIASAAVGGGNQQTVLNNFGFLYGLNGAFIPGTVSNFAGAKILTWFGTPIEGGLAGRNYRNGGLLTLPAQGSYCFHPGKGQTASNWGYCIAAANGFWIDQRYGSASDWGGPLVPAAKNFDGRLVYNGTLSSDYEYDQIVRPKVDGPHSCVGFPGSSPALVDHNGTLDLFSTTYTYLEQGQPRTVTYLPLTYGYPMQNSQDGSGGGGTVTFAFDHLTAAQEAAFQAAVTYGPFSPYAGGPVTPNRSTGSFTLDGQTYAWCGFSSVQLQFSATASGDGLNGHPTPGVYFFEGSNKSYYLDPSPQSDNPYYLVNPATVLLTGARAEQPGRTVVEPGWTLVVGRKVTNPDLSVAAEDDAFAPALVAGASLELESAVASTPAIVDGQAGESETLHGALVLDNPTQATFLPNLLGDGWLVLTGKATTTLAGPANAFAGIVYLADGTLAIAGTANFDPPLRLAIGSNDPLKHDPVFDVSHAGGQALTLAALTQPGYQIAVFTDNGGDGLHFPTIALGSTALTIGDGVTANQAAYHGALTGTGRLVVAAGTTLHLGHRVYARPRNVQLLSTFDGGTTVQSGGSLVVDSRGALGLGGLENAGTVSLGSETPYLPFDSSPALPTDYGLPNLRLFVPTDLRQSASGTVTLRVNGGDLDADAGSGAGVTYQQVVVAGGAQLAGTLVLALEPGLIVPTSGLRLVVLTARRGIAGTFDQLVVSGAAASATPVYSAGALSVVLAGTGP